MFLKWLIFLFLLCASSQAATYYVDFVGGSDAAAGTSTGTAWKHAPADANATGVAASTVIQPGDTINFKGGVAYNGIIAPSRSGTSVAPVTWQTEPGWGTGQAIIEGTAAGVTNGFGFNVVNTDWQVINNLEIRDAWGNLIAFNGSNNSTVTNCVLHHAGWFPYNIANDGGQGYGVAITGSGNITVVSNLVFDINESAVYPTTASTNLIVWGNTLTNIQDHAMFSTAWGYTVVCFNQIDWQTNAVNHDDGIHVMRWGWGNSLAVFANNRFFGNSQDLFLNSQATNGTIYVFGNIFANPRSSVGDGQDGDTTGFLVNTQEYPWDSIYFFNNSVLLKNAGNGGFSISPRGINTFVSTNIFNYNNLFYQSTAAYYDSRSNSVLNYYSGYNVFTNNWRTGIFNGPYPSTVDLPTFKADYPGVEANSKYDKVTFANFIPTDAIASDYHLAAGSAGIGAGTNLSTLVPASTFNFLPARYQPDPTKDPLLVARGTTWDVGAMQGTNAISPVASQTVLGWGKYGWMKSGK